MLLNFFSLPPKGSVDPSFLPSVCSAGFPVTVSDHFNPCPPHAYIRVRVWVIDCGFVCATTLQTHTTQTLDLSHALIHPLHGTVCPWSVCPLLACLCPHHPLRLALPFIPCDHRYPSHFPHLHTPIYTHTYTPRQQDPETSSTGPWSRNECTKTNALAYIRTHALAHKCEHTCHVMCGAPWGPDEWNLSVGSRYTEHHRGSLSSQKSTKPQSRSSRLHHKYRHRDRYAAMCAHTPGPIHGQAGNTQKSKEEEQKKKKASDKSSRKTFAFWHAKTRAQLDHVLSRTHSYAHTPHKLSRTVTVQKGK